MYYIAAIVVHLLVVCLTAAFTFPDELKKTLTCAREIMYIILLSFLIKKEIREYVAHLSFNLCIHLFLEKQ